MFLLKKIILILVIINFVLLTQIFSQQESSEVKNINFGYSTNPPAKITKKPNKPKSELDISKSSPEDSFIEENITETDTTNKNTENVTIAKKTREVAKKASKANMSPTEIYKVGVGDVLFINLQNATAKYYTVLMDGTIDYPLAGKLVSVLDLTTDEIEDLLREKITLYENPQVNVKVREYASHKINVEGLAKVGKYYLQREAMPLVVIKTLVGVEQTASNVVIEREGKESVTLDLDDPKTDEFLVESGDTVKFEAINKKNVDTDIPQFYFVGEKVCSGGKKSFHNGITLVQAIFEACGEINSKLKTITIIRKNKSGSFISVKHDLKEILQGKESDPVLIAGDMIDADK